MKCISQLLIIFLFSAMAELLKGAIPYALLVGIYGMIFLLVLISDKVR